MRVERSQLYPLYYSVAGMVVRSGNATDLFASQALPWSSNHTWAGGGRGVAGLRYVFYTPHVRIANAEVIADKQCTEDGRQA